MRVVCFVLLVLVLVPLPLEAAPKGAGATVGEPAPSFSLPGPDGKERGLGEFLGRPVVVSFWASWCSPCLEEMPLLDSLHQRLDGQAMVLGLNIDENRAAADAVIRRFALILPVLFDGKQSVVATWRPPAMPTTYLIGADGTIQWMHKGAMSEDEIVSLEARVRALLPADGS